MKKSLKCVSLCLSLFLLSSVISAAPSKKSDEKVKVVEVVSDEGAFQAKNVSNQVGNVKVALKGGVGSFQFYTLNHDKVASPVLSGYDESTSSFFSIQAGKKEYKLIDNAGIVIGTRKSQRGSQIVYVVPGLARLFVKFDAFRSDPNKPEDILKVTAIIKNRSGQEEVFAIKNVLDTVLGEQRGLHFSTAQDLAINNEMQFRKMDKIRWVKSDSTKASMQILLTGANITSPEVVSLANKDLLSHSSWVPNVVRSRSFDSVISYNNSAVCLNWESVTLAPDGEKTFIYYIAFGNDGQAPRGDEFIQELERQIRERGEEKKYSVKEFEDLYQSALSYAQVGDYEKAFDKVMKLWQNPENRNERLESLKNYIESQVDASSAEKFETQIETLTQNSEVNKVPETEKNDKFTVSNSNEPLPSDTQVIKNDKIQSKKPEEKKEEPVEKIGETPKADDSQIYREKKELPPREEAKDVDSPDFNPDELPKEKLNFNYVQGLIDRIYSLESEDDLDRTELIRLNAELDAIMKKLREM